MSDHRERACKLCSSYLHHEDDCSARATQEPKDRSSSDRGGKTTIELADANVVIMGETSAPWKPPKSLRVDRTASAPVLTTEQKLTDLERWRDWIELGSEMWNDAHRKRQGRTAEESNERYFDTVFEQYSPEAWQALKTAHRYKRRKS